MRILICMLFLVLSSLGSALANPEIHINVPAYQLQLVDHDKVIREYNIAVGTPYEQTPIGSFQIFYKEQFPTWIPGNNFSDHTPVAPGPDNPLGTRWMEFKTNYGIHGTNKGWDINYPVSGGCIRMQDADVRQLYELVDVGTPVIITYETMFIIEKADGLYLKVLPDIYNRASNSHERLQQLYQPYALKYPVFKNPQSFTLPVETATEVKIAMPLR